MINEMLTRRTAKLQDKDKFKIREKGRGNSAEDSGLRHMSELQNQKRANLQNQVSRNLNTDHSKRVQVEEKVKSD